MSSGTIQWLLRGLVVAALLTIAALLLTPGIRRDPRDFDRAVASSEAIAPASDRTGSVRPSFSSSAPPETGPSDPTAASELQTLPDDAGPADERSSESPIVAGIEELLEAQSEFLGQQPQGLRSDLAEADATLARIKRSNAAAIRDLSRQRRVVGASSPNLIIVIEDGFSVEDAERLSAEPLWKDVLGAGKRFTNIYSIGRNAPRSLAACTLEGLTFDQAARAETRVVESLNLAEALWLAGYRTGVVGDLTPFFERDGNSLAPSGRRIDFAMGYLASDEGDDFWLNGSRVNTTGGKPRTVRLSDESSYFATQPQDERPFCLLLSFPGRAAQDEPSSHNTVQAILARLQIELATSGMAEQTATIFLGIPMPSRGEEDDIAQERSRRATLRLSWPGRWKQPLTDDRLLTISEFPSLVLEFAGSAPPPWRRHLALSGSLGAADARAVGWRSPGGVLYRWGRLLIWDKNDGSRSVRLKEDDDWSENLAEAQPELLEDFDRFVASKSVKR